MSTSDTIPHVDLLRFSRTVGILGMEGRGFYYPSDTAIGKDGKLYVTNRSEEFVPEGVRVSMLNLDSEYFGSFGSFGTGEGQITSPTGIAVDSVGRVYVSDESLDRITVFDSSGEFQSMWGAHGVGPGELDRPSGIAFDGDDDLYVVDSQNNRVQKFTSDGRFLLGFGSEGSADGQLNLPWGITVDPKGDIYVADWRNDRVQRFSADGEFLAKYGRSGQGDGEFRRPAGVAVDDEGYIYVADWGNERLQVLDREGRFVLKLRGEATSSPWAEDFLTSNLDEAEARAKADLEPELEFFKDDPHTESSHVEKYFWAPVSVKFDGEGRLYVTEGNRQRIQIYQRAS